MSADKLLAYAPFVVATMSGLLLAWLMALSALSGRRGGRADHAARRMARGRDLHALDARGAARTAKRLGVEQRGLLIARTVQGGRALFQGWEDCSVDVAGPRVGKTTCRVIPAILEAPGAVVTTSNKRDALDATREPRSKVGPVFVLDPQAIAGSEPAAFWWNPLGYVRDATRAAQLADVFAAAGADPGARTDAFFQPRGQRVVAALLLAAAASGRTIDYCHQWVTDPRSDEPVGLLRDHGYPLVADGLAGDVNAPEKQRAGVYATAERALAWLADPAALAWVTPGAGRRAFDACVFAAGTGTLYLLSREGPGSAGALVAGLTVAVCDAAEQLATRSAGGRLQTPLVVVLDEVANVCRWPQLPNLYSHYGSRGIAVLAFAQSWSQLVECFGRDNARKLWSAATIRCYGGGVSEHDFLSELSALCGEYDHAEVARGRSRHGASTTRTTRRRRVLEVADLAALPKGRAVVLSAGAPPVLCRTLPWWER